MKTMRNNLWVKILAVLLIVGLTAAGGAAGIWTVHTATEYFGGADGQYEGTSECDLLFNEYSNMAIQRFCLGQLGDDLNYLGRQQVENLAQALGTGETNFRYRILTTDGVFLEGNSTVENLDGVVRSVRYDTFYFAPEEYAYYGIDGYNSDWSYYDMEGYSYDYGVGLDNFVNESDTAMAAESAEEEILATDVNETAYFIEYGLDSSLSVNDEFAAGAQQLRSGFDQARRIGILAAAALLGALLLTIWMMTAAGYRPDREGVSLCGLHRIPLDLWLAIEICAGIFATFAGVALLETLFGLYFPREYTWGVCWGFGALLALVNLLILLPTLVTIAARAKAGTLWKNTILYRIFHFFWKMLRQIRLFWRAAGLVILYLVLFSFLSVRKVWDGFAAILFVLLALGGVALVLYWCEGWARLRRGGARIAAGNLDARVDTRRLLPDLKAHANDLNSISVGMTRAVEEQRKSDLFQAELITNVSHDLKTPLTSIINYVDLLKKLDLQDPTAREYLDVLDRKSQRLKTLTEDLVEASKASAGVLKVETTRISLTQCVEQAAAEYSERLEGAQLTLVTTLPESELHVEADGRYLWRIFDNLFSNCVKYAMPGTRVYLDVVREGDRAAAYMKNISKEPLNIPADQLMQRFVRGDSSRHTEGSGLGLSIAKSLAALQGADFQLDVDGDLFKVSLSFPAVD